MLGGALGVLVYTELWVGFTAVSALLILGLAQTLVSFRGNSLIPGLGGNGGASVGGKANGGDGGNAQLVGNGGAGGNSAGAGASLGQGGNGGLLLGIPGPNGHAGP